MLPVPCEYIASLRQKNGQSDPSSDVILIAVSLVILRLKISFKASTVKVASEDAHHKPAPDGIIFLNII